MRNLNGYLKRALSIFSISLVLSILLLVNLSPSYALDGFDIKSDFYHVWDGKKIDTTIYITISTTETPRVLTYYTITIPQENLRPEVYSLTKNIKLDPTYYDRDQATDMIIDLENTVVSKENPVNIKLTFSTEQEGTNLSLISSIKDTQSRVFSFTYPNKLGEISWSSSPITDLTQKGSNTEIKTASPSSTKVNLTLGEKILYSFQISRNLINSSEDMISSEISLPPNSNNQFVLITELTPTPNESYKDIDGNYILQYEIAPKSNIDVKINGYIVMDKSITGNITEPEIESETVWEIKDTALEKRITKYLKDAGIPEDIEDIAEIEDSSIRQLLYKTLYLFLVENLEPNTLTIGSLTGGTRLGGERALSEQALSTSEDYSDSMIALYRYFGIPARLVIGYVTNISDYHPDGMYHYWVEYFDTETKDWIIVDPFLEDYSHTSLLNRAFPDHISLLYRYYNPNTPKLTYYSENDFQVSLIQEEIPIYNKMSSEIYLQPYRAIDSHLQGYIKVRNLGNTIIDSVEIVKSNPDITEYMDFVENNTSKILLPGESMEIKFNIPPQEITTPFYTVVKGISGNLETDEIYTEEEIEILEQNITLDIFAKLLSILIYFILAVPIYFVVNKMTKKYG